MYYNMLERDYINTKQIEEGIRTRDKWLKDQKKKFGKIGSTSESVQGYNAVVVNENTTGLKTFDLPTKKTHYQETDYSN